MRSVHLLALASLALAACPDDGIESGSDTTSSTDASDGSDATTTTTTTSTTSTTTDASTTTPPDTAVEVEVGPPTIGWVILQFPAEHTGAPGTSFSVYGRVYAAGVTDGAGQGVGITAEVGFGTGPVDDWVWGPATYNVDVDGANDEYTSGIELPNFDGEYRFAMRFKLGDGDWVYADRDGLDNGFDVTNTGVLTVVTPDPAAIDWCNLQFPEAVEANPGAPVGTIYGQVYEPGISDAISGTDDAYTIVGELGWGNNSDMDLWTWVAAGYAKDVGNNDEFEATFEAPQIGTYRYAYRFRFEGDDDGWVYCDLTGLGDGFDVQSTGSLTVVAAPPQRVDFATLRPELANWAVSETAPIFEVVVYEPGVTDQAGQGPDVDVEIGYFPADATGEPAPTWVVATYRGDENGLGANDNDVYGAAFPSITPGAYRVVARVILDDGEAVMVDATGSPDGYDADDAAIANVSPAVPPIVDWCKLNAPEVTTAAPGATFSGVQVQAYEAGVTPNATTIEAELGIGPYLGAAENVGTWVPAPRVASTGNDDLFGADMTAPLEEGSYNLAGRVRFVGSQTWVYCDDDGSNDGYDGTQTSRLVVAAPRVDFCRIQFPTEPITVSMSEPVEDAPVLYGLVYEPGVTGEAGSHTPPIIAQVGYGAIGSMPDTNWSWVNGTFNGYLGNGFGQMTNDEYRGQLRPTSASATVSWAWRVSLDEGETWVYCDEAGSQPFDPGKAGELVLVP